MPLNSDVCIECKDECTSVPETEGSYVNMLSSSPLRGLYFWAREHPVYQTISDNYTPQLRPLSLRRYPGLNQTVNYLVNFLLLGYENGKNPVLIATHRDRSLEKVHYERVKPNYNNSSAYEHRLFREYTPIEHSNKTNCASNLTNYEIIRHPVNIMVAGSYFDYGTEFQDQKFQSIDLSIVGGTFQEIMNQPWSAYELKEGKRIIRIERFQNQCTLLAKFQIISRPVILTQREMPESSNFLEVACIRFDHTDGESSDYFITSVEVIKIVEYLVGNKASNSIHMRKERGRVRSNLAPLWFKTWSHLSPLLHFENQIERSKSQYPLTTLRSMRVLLWSHLGYALRKAMLFYCVCLPTESNAYAGTCANDADYLVARETARSFIKVNEKH